MQKPPAPLPDEVLTGWLEWLETHEPKHIEKADISKATKIRSLRSAGTAGGMVIRLQDIEGNETDIALNAICAIDLARTISRYGASIGWIDDRLNTLIDPRHKTDA